MAGASGQKRGSGLAKLVLGAAAVCVMPMVAHAGLFNLENGNSTAAFRTGDEPGPSGMHNWNVNNVKQMDRQWFWYKDAAGDIKPMQTLSQVGGGTIDTTGGGSGKADFLRLNYSGVGYEMTVTYQLIGGVNGGPATVNANISINNTGSAELSYQLYQGGVFALGGDSSDDMLTINEGSRVYATDGRQAGELVTLTQPSHYQGGSADLIDQLDNNTLGELTDSTTGEVGDSAYVLYWDWRIAPGENQTMSLTMQLHHLPEPAMLGMLGISAGGILLRRRRK